MADQILKKADKPCCGPSSGNPSGDADDRYTQHALTVPQAADALKAKLAAELVPIPGGFFDMGTRKSRFYQDYDAPRRKVKLTPYAIGATVVTNAQFARFVEDSGYVTVAEHEGWSYVFHTLLEDPAAYPISPPGLPWWRKVEGAYWHAPRGPGSDLAGLGDHPVTQVCWYDALAYCTWAGRSLPSEAQGERAARGGLERCKFPWGNAMTPDGQHMMNTWQGDFPRENTQEDGYLTTAPARSFAPNGYGLYNTTGNVWEWVQDFYEDAPPPKGPLRDPFGPATGTSRIQRGGSFLCHVSYCDRYHVHSRTQNDPDSATSHSGFRVASASLI